jgi:hypothetical protein
MKLLSLLAIPLGFMCVVYGLRGKSILLKGQPAAGLERAVTVCGGFLLIACGLGFAFLLWTLFSKSSFQSPAR